MRIIVTGSRAHDDRGRVFADLDELLRKAIDRGESLTVVHGANRSGADLYAELWYLSRHAMGYPVDRDRVPADWHRLGNAAGPVRNQAMVDAGSDACHAWPSERNDTANRGTTDCAIRAARAGIPVVVHGDGPAADAVRAAAIKATPSNGQEALPL